MNLQKIINFYENATFDTKVTNRTVSDVNREKKSFQTVKNAKTLSDIPKVVAALEDPSVFNFFFNLNSPMFRMTFAYTPGTEFTVKKKVIKKMPWEEKLKKLTEEKSPLTGLFVALNGVTDPTADGYVKLYLRTLPSILGVYKIAVENVKKRKFENLFECFTSPDAEIFKGFGLVKISAPKKERIFKRKVNLVVTSGNKTITMKATDNLVVQEMTLTIDRKLCPFFLSINEHTLFKRMFSQATGENFVRAVDTLVCDYYGVTAKHDDFPYLKKKFLKVVERLVKDRDAFDVRQFLAYDLKEEPLAKRPKKDEKGKMEEKPAVVGVPVPEQPSPEEVREREFVLELKNIERLPKTHWQVLTKAVVEGKLYLIYNNGAAIRAFDRMGVNYGFDPVLFPTTGKANVIVGPKGSEVNDGILASELIIFQKIKKAAMDAAEKFHSQDATLYDDSSSETD